MFRPWLSCKQDLKGKKGIDYRCVKLAEGHSWVLIFLVSKVSSASRRFVFWELCEHLAIAYAYRNAVLMQFTALKDKAKVWGDFWHDFR